jgi:pyruvate formate lyase activating enzyme
VNDGGEHFRAVAAFLAGAPALARVELLPSHLTAGAKYAMLGRAYDPGLEAEPYPLDLSPFDRHGIRSCVL